MTYKEVLKGNIWARKLSYRLFQKFQLQIRLESQVIDYLLKLFTVEEFLLQHIFIYINSLSKTYLFFLTAVE